MSSSRRDFLAGLASAGALAAVPRPARASLAGPLYPPMNLSAFDVPVHHGRPLCSRRLLRHHLERQRPTGYRPTLRPMALRAFSCARPPSTSIPIHTSCATFSLSTSSPSSLCPAAQLRSIPPSASRSLRRTSSTRSMFTKPADTICNSSLRAPSQPRPFTADEYKLQGELFTEIGKAHRRLRHQARFPQSHEHSWPAARGGRRHPQCIRSKLPVPRTRRCPLPAGRGRSRQPQFANTAAESSSCTSRM